MNIMSRRTLVAGVAAAVTVPSVTSAAETCLTPEQMAHERELLQRCALDLARAVEQHNNELLHQFEAGGITSIQRQAWWMVMPESARQWLPSSWHNNIGTR
jgi:hypothetical protein